MKKITLLILLSMFMTSCYTDQVIKKDVETFEKAKDSLEKVTNGGYEDFLDRNKSDSNIDDEDTDDTTDDFKKDLDDMLDNLMK